MWIDCDNLVQFSGVPIFYKYILHMRVESTKPTLSLACASSTIHFAQAAWNYYDSRSFSTEEQESWNAQKKKAASSLADQKK